MTNKQKHQAVEKALQYLIEEGIVVKQRDGNYRLKTDIELKEEMEAILND